jgi:hypothetical protein
MLHVSTKQTLVWHTFVNVKFNGVMEFAGAVKIRGFESFSICKSRGDEYSVGNGSTLKLSGRKGNLKRMTKETNMSVLTLKNTHFQLFRQQWLLYVLNELTHICGSTCHPNTN